MKLPNFKKEKYQSHGWGETSYKFSDLWNYKYLNMMVNFATQVFDELFEVQQ